ncbi:pyridoxamine 5'-phosphate oxidase family protein [Actinoplanes sp. NPDC048967]|uniref:pyridoxamine 5'-phosphate oxidase family protein n=1 Tax=Actinoplanes sp. NPDC048967 TaxID=3155269 RepID=UPI0033C3DFFB
MSQPEPRPRAIRRADVLAKLTAPVADVWVATSAPEGPYLVPLTLAWLRERIVLATDGRSRTAMNLGASGTARLALGGTRDVVMIDAVLEETFPVAQAPSWVADGYAAGTDWDPRAAGGTYAYLILRPDRIQAWREENEHQGRTLMRDGAWLS